MFNRNPMEWYEFLKGELKSVNNNRADIYMHRHMSDKSNVYTYIHNQKFNFINHRSNSSFKVSKAIF